MTFRAGVAVDGDGKVIGDPTESTATRKVSATTTAALAAADSVFSGADAHGIGKNHHQDLELLTQVGARDGGSSGGSSSSTSAFPGLANTHAHAPAVLRINTATS